MRKWWAWLGIMLAAGAGSGAVHADYRGGPIKIGVLNDQSGLYADIAGTASIWMARKAVEDFGAAAKGMKVEIIGGDHLNKPDVGLSIARQWFDVEKVDVIADVPTSSVALAVNELIRDKNKVFLAVGPAPPTTGKACSRIPCTGSTTPALAKAPATLCRARRRHPVLPDRRLPSAMRSSATPSRWWQRAAARCSARSDIRSRAPTSSSFLVQVKASKANIIGPRTPAATPST